MGLKVRGYAAIFGNKDLTGEVLVRGAFTDWIAANPDTDLPIYWNHDHVWSNEMPIGVTTALKQDRKGLYFEGVIADTAKGLEVQELLKAGAIKPASFGFRVNDREQKKGVWHLKSVDPREISPVNWGANPLAYIEVVPDQESQEEPIE